MTLALDDWDGVLIKLQLAESFSTTDIPNKKGFANKLKAGKQPWVLIVLQ